MTQFNYEASLARSQRSEWQSIAFGFERERDALKARVAVLESDHVDLSWKFAHVANTLKAAKKLLLDSNPELSAADIDRLVNEEVARN